MQKKITITLRILAILLSNIMCALIAYHYRAILCCGEHGGCSAPASIAFFYAIPFSIAILLCLIPAEILRRKGKKQ